MELTICSNRILLIAYESPIQIDGHKISKDLLHVLSKVGMSKALKEKGFASFISVCNAIITYFLAVKWCSEWVVDEEKLRFS